VSVIHSNTPCPVSEQEDTKEHDTNTWHILAVQGSGRRKSFDWCVYLAVLLWLQKQCSTFNCE
jgi:hypothetical protein